MSGNHDGTADDEVSAEARMMAERVRQRAAGMPDAADIAGMAMDASTRDMTPAEIRALATQAIRQAEQVSFLLGRLAGLLDTEAGEPGV